MNADFVGVTYTLSIHLGIHPSFSMPPKGFQQPLIVEDLDSPFTQQPIAQPAESFMQNKVLVEGFPPETQEFVLKLFLESLLPTVQCTEVKLRGNMAVATFTGVIGMTMCIVFFCQNFHFSFYCLQILITSCNSQV